MTPNAQQQAVLDWSTQSTGSLEVKARAGTGKTKGCIIPLCHHIPHGRVFLGAYNRSIADELQSLLPNRPGFTANTIHGTGLKAFKSQCRRVEVDADKVRNIARANWAMDAKTASAAAMVIGYMKQAGMGVEIPYEDLDEWEKIIDHFDLEDEIPATMRRKMFLESCVWTYELSLDWCQGKGAPYGMPTLDFNDMLLAPLYFKIPLPQVDWAMLDEAQDTSMLRRRIVQGMVSNGGRMGGRMVFVGDDRQAIYGFSGADNDAMDIIRREMNAASLPLNVTYRCPKAVVEFAQQWVPDYTAHPSAPDGVIRTIQHFDLWGQDFNTGNGKDVILCRMTRPLVGIAINLRNRRIPCVVEGQNAKSLLYLVNKWGDVPIDSFLDLLAGFEKEQVQKFELKDDLDKVARTRDRVGSVRDLAMSMGVGATTRDLARQIEFLFRDQSGHGMLTLCTIHRSKGREWDRVFLIGRQTYQPGWWAKQEWELRQEENLEYVAVTRAKRELVEVEVPAKTDRESKEWWELN